MGEAGASPLPSATVVIRALNEASWIGRVIDAVLAQGAPAEVVVVDSGSSDPTVEVANSRGARVLHVAPADFTYGRALNIGFAECRTDVAVALSAHALPVGAGWLRALLEPFRDERVAATYGRQAPMPGLDPFRARDIRRYWGDQAAEDRTGAIRYSNGNGAVRVSDWKRHRFDEDLIANEDAEWAAWAVNDGRRVVYVPGATVLHSHADGPLRWYRRRLAEERVAARPVEGVLPILRQAARDVRGDMRAIAGDPGLWRWAPFSPVLRVTEAAAVLRGRGRRS